MFFISRSPDFELLCYHVQERKIFVDLVYNVWRTKHIIYLLWCKEFHRHFIVGY